MSLLIAPLEALTDSRLSDPERRVLLSLYSFRNKNANTVWPSLSSLAERANMRDETRVSKLTKSLSEKGWLTKKKRGFTGSNQYNLTIPPNLDSDTNLEPDANLDGNTNPNLDSDTKSNLDCESKCNELQIEQQIEQQRVNPQKSSKSFDPTDIAFPDGLNVSAWIEWCDYRKSKGKRITDKAATKQFNLLLGYDLPTQQKIIDTSIANDYQGLFEPKGGANGSHLKNISTITDATFGPGSESF